MTGMGTEVGEIGFQIKEDTPFRLKESHKHRILLSAPGESAIGECSWEPQKRASKFTFQS